MMIASPIAQWSDDAVFILDFMNSTMPAPVTFTRASSAWYFNSSGVLMQVSTDAPRFDYGSFGGTTLLGLLIEEARTNRVVQCRDLTQSAWTKTSMTTALDQTGIDGTANAASSATATTANATVLQTYSNIAASRVFSVFLKRITGTGTIQLTQDNGSTWTTVTLTSSWQRFILPQQSTLNPTFGMKIVTSGDVVGFDCSQLEAGTFATSPILTTTAAVTRAIDVANVSSIPWFNATVGSFAIEAILRTAAPTNNQSTADFNDGSINNRIGLYTTPAGAADATVTISGTSALSGVTIGGPSAGAVFRQAMRYIASNNKAAYAGSIDSSGTLTASALPTGISQLRIGDRQDGTRPINGWVRRFRYWNYGFTNAQLQRVST